MYGNAAAPPPTPSAGGFNDISNSAAADALATLLNNLPSTHLSLPSRRRTTAPTVATPIISFSDENLSSSLSDLLLSPSNLGFFQLTHHPIPPQLARSAESDSLSLFSLTPDQKESYFPAQNWPLGFEDGAFCFDGSAELTESLPLTSMREFISGMEKLGLNILNSVSRGTGFQNTVGDDPTRFRTLVTIVEMSPGEKPGRKYPFVIRLQYQIRSMKYSLVTDSGPVTCLSPQVDSVFISLGDILQVWSNGRVKKVRGSYALGGNDMNSGCVSVTVELTLPTNTMVSPLLPIPLRNNDHDCAVDDQDDDDDDNKKQVIIKDKFKFKPFLFDEIYAWKVCHSGVLYKDPLDKYKVESM